jgi:hypothetical protein
MRTSNLTEIENVLVCVLDKLRPEEGSIGVFRNVVDTLRTLDEVICRHLRRR